MLHRTVITLFVLFSGFFLIAPVMAQDEGEKKIIHLFGQTLNDSLQPIPYVHIILHNKKLATASDLRGYFSFPAEVSDTLIFRAMGYKYHTFVVRDTFSVKYPSFDIMMETDTIVLKELVVYPWQGNYERFKQAILAYDLPTTDLDRAYRNLAIMDIQSVLYNSPPTPTIAFRNTMKLYNDRLYWAGQLPPVNITNPIAWAQFFKALKNGDLKLK